MAMAGLTQADVTALFRTCASAFPCAAVSVRVAGKLAIGVRVAPHMETTMQADLGIEPGTSATGAAQFALADLGGRAPRDRDTIDIVSGGVTAKAVVRQVTLDQGGATVTIGWELTQ
jgi:hypothetical protein